MPEVSITQADRDEDEAYEIGKEDGCSEAIQEIDLATGGDGEYRFCTNHDPERHCPDAATMKARIIARFEAAISQARIEDREAVQGSVDALLKAWERLSRAVHRDGRPLPDYYDEFVDLGKAISPFRTGDHIPVGDERG